MWILWTSCFVVRCSVGFVKSRGYQHTRRKLIWNALHFCRRATKGFTTPSPCHTPSGVYPAIFRQTNLTILRSSVFAFQELHDNIEQPTRVFAHSGRFWANLAFPCCSTYGFCNTSIHSCNRSKFPFSTSSMTNWAR